MSAGYRPFRSLNTKTIRQRPAKLSYFVILPVAAIVVIWKGLSLLSRNGPSISVSHYRGRASSGTFDPRQVFLLYNRTPKTSSSVAASILRNSYVSAGLAIHSGPLNDYTALKGFNGRFEHMGLEPGSIEEIERIIRKPVILVVSTRKGEDWLESASIWASRFTHQDKANCTYNPLTHKVQASYYLKYLPIRENEELYIIPWRVIRHENVVCDVEGVLNRLGVPVVLEGAVGERSRSSMDCEPKKANKTEANYMDMMNKKVWTERADKYEFACSSQGTKMQQRSK